MKAQRDHIVVRQQFGQDNINADLTGFALRRQLTSSPFKEETFRLLYSQSWHLCTCASVNADSRFAVISDIRQGYPEGIVPSKIMVTHLHPGSRYPELSK